MHSNTSQSARPFLAVVCLSLYLYLVPTVQAQERIYTYVNERGMKVITNIPPTERALQAANSAIAVATQLAVESDRDARAADRVAVSQSRPNTVPPVMTGSIDAIITDHAARYGLDPDLIRAVISAESAFDPRAVSRKGALGLMQLMPDTAKRYGVRHPFDPNENIAGGVRYLNDLLGMFNGNLRLALAAYNAGENLVARIQRVPNYSETRTYIARISRMFDMQRSPYLVSDGDHTPRIRMVRRADGILEITNVDGAGSYEER